MTSAEKPDTERPDIRIRLMQKDDYPAVRDILQEGMDTGEATYEAKAPSWEGFSTHRIMDLAFVAEEFDAAGDATILGWITASPTSHRAVFRGVIEDSIYVSSAAVGKGVAGALLDHLLAEAGRQGYWTMHSTIFPENEGSVKLHESRGFTKVGIFHHVAKMTYGPKKGQWRDNLMMEKLLDTGPAAEDMREDED